ncbi:uncharacterized protein FFNC_15570 [Fusarium fujikuroi]|nr:uncharacterized protein FFNC_15570 [Fusarium fujikuroi]
MEGHSVPDFGHVIGSTEEPLEPERFKAMKRCIEQQRATSSPWAPDAVSAP